MKKLILLLPMFLCLSLPLFAQVDTAWVRRYDGSANSYDDARAIAVDDFGNVYVTGESYGNGTSADYLTIKYKSNGDTFWVRRYNGPENDYDDARAIAVDDFGNVYVTGRSYCSATSLDYLTIKYNPDGDTAWVRRYDGPGNDDDWALAITVDDFGNVYVTGYSYGSGTMGDYATIKYDSNGDTAWVRRYDGPGNVQDLAFAIALNDSGNVYVTGESYVSGSNSDYATIKYTPDGDTVWMRRYSGPGNDNDRAWAIAVDDSGNIYVTGRSYGSMTYLDYATIKYNPNGDTAWVRRYNGPENGDDYARAIAVDAYGNVCVTGYSYSLGVLEEYVTDYVTIKYTPEGDTVWVRTYNGPGNSYDLAEDIVVDDFGDVYVTGYSYGSGTIEDYATIKYDSNGNTVWVRRYNGQGNSYDYARAIAIDDSGNVYVTGTSFGSGSDCDYVTIKYTQFLRGDANEDGSLTVSDVVYLINYLFKGGPPPFPILQVGDSNCDGEVTVSDVIYLINYLFKGGPPPRC